MLESEQLRDHSLELLSQLGSRPAVSFQEGAVASYVASALGDAGVPMEADRYGNLIAHLAGPAASQEGHPPVAFVAHMDHPGFEVVEAGRGEVVARALGGVPQACFSQGVPVQLLLADGARLKGETAGAQGSEDERLVKIRVEGSDSIQLPCPVVLDLPDFSFDGETITMRALDDLAGCACVLATLRVQAQEEGAGSVYGIFTRAEEVGLIGARLLAEGGALPMETLVVSLEASRTLPGAAIGEGPVIRVGDATFTFDAEAEALLAKAREELSQASPGFKVQRQLMSGGTCEASAFRYYGYRTTGVAFPLGNYHNATPEGGVGAEYIHVDDFLGGVKLAIQAARSVGSRRDSQPWRRMRDLPEEYRRRLTDPAGR